MKRSALLAATLAVLLTACGGGGGGDAAVDTTAPAGTEKDGTDATTAPTTPAAAPTEVPDPCTLLTEAEAFTLLTPMSREEYAAKFGSADLPARFEPDGLDGEPACLFGEGDNRPVGLAVSIIEVPAETLASYRDARLDQYGGRPLDGVGDAARVGGSTPVRLLAIQGFWEVDLYAYVGGDSGDTDLDAVDQRFATAARLVLQRLADG